MKFKAFRVEQWNSAGDRTYIYLTHMTVDELLKNYKIDRYTPENPDGYQRMPLLKRLTGSKGTPVYYLREELGVFPTSILLNVRGDVSFSTVPGSDDESFVELTIPDDEPLWLIDGQHRVEALRMIKTEDPSFADYPLSVSIMNLQDVFDEMLHFYIVNKRQKAVPTDLAYRNLQRMYEKKGENWLYAMEGIKGVRFAISSGITDYLNQAEDSPWKGRIKLVAEDWKEDKHIVKDSTMTGSLVQVVKQAGFEGMSIKDLGRLLTMYWRAITNIYAGIFEKPEKYQILATPGLYAFHGLFPTIFARCAAYEDVSETKMTSILELLKKETPGIKYPFDGPLTLDLWDKAHVPADLTNTSYKALKEVNLALTAKLKQAESA